MSFPRDIVFPEVESVSPEGRTVEYLWQHAASFSSERLSQFAVPPAASTRVCSPASLLSLVFLILVCQG